MNVAVVVLVYNKRALILRRSETAPWHPLTWNLPGGNVENETTEDAAKRECKEETGIEIDQLIPLDVCHTAEFTIHSYASVVDGDDFLLSYTDGILENDVGVWIGREELSKYEFCIPEIRQILEKSLNRLDTI